MKHKFAYPKAVGFIHGLGDFAIAYDFSNDYEANDYEPYPQFADVLSTVAGEIVTERVYNIERYTVSPHPSVAQIRWAFDNRYVFENRDMAIATNGKIDGHSYMSPGTLWFSSTFGSNLMQNLEVQMKGTYDFASIAYTLVAKLVIWLYGRPKYGGHGPHKMTIEEAEQYQMKYPKD